MTIFTWIVFGLVTGIIANVLDPRPSEGGILGAVILGIAGAFLGGLLASVILGGGSFTFSSFSLAMLGALLLLLVGRVVRRA